MTAVPSGSPRRGSPDEGYPSNEDLIEEAEHADEQIAYPDADVQLTNEKGKQGGRGPQQKTVYRSLEACGFVRGFKIHFQVKSLCILHKRVFKENASRNPATSPLGRPRRPSTPRFRRPAAGPPPGFTDQPVGFVEFGGFGECGGSGA